MIRFPEDKNDGKVLYWAHNNDLCKISLCRGPSSLLSTTLKNQEFLYKGYAMAGFPDGGDEMTPMVFDLPEKTVSGVSEN